jgi:hypothetical protein
VPVVSAASAAPASAATSGAAGTQLVVESAQFWVMDWSEWSPELTIFGVVPQIVLRNPSADPTGGVTLTLVFATADFTGSLPITDPPEMGWSNLALITGPDWDSQLIAPQVGDTEVRFQLINDAGLVGNQTVTVGRIAASDNPGSLDCTNDPTAQSIPFLVEVTGPGFAASAGRLERIPRPRD